MRAGIVALAVVGLVCAGTAGADVIWDENTQGVLSENGASPTSLVLVSPSDVVIGIGNGTSAYLTFTVQAGGLVGLMVIDPGFEGYSIISLYSGASYSGTLLCSPSPSPETPTDLLDGTTCTGLSSLGPGDYTVYVFDKYSVPWTLTIDTVPAEIFSDGFESGDLGAWSGQ